MKPLRLRSIRARPVARRGGASYLVGVIFRRLLSLLVLVGLVLTPAGMLGGAPAMAAMNDAVMAASDGSDSSDASHCADMQMPAEQEAPDNCCVMTCVAIPAVGGELAFQAALPRTRESLPRMRDPHGLGPEAEPPPPRIS